MPAMISGYVLHLKRNMLKNVELKQFGAMMRGSILNDKNRIKCNELGEASM